MQVGGLSNAILAYRPPTVLRARPSSADFMARTREDEARRLLGRLQTNLGEVMQTNPSRRTLLVQKLDPVARSASSL